jgi:hypothetical protein
LACHAGGDQAGKEMVRRVGRVLLVVRSPSGVDGVRKVNVVGMGDLVAMDASLEDVLRRRLVATLVAAVGM